MKGPATRNCRLVGSCGSTVCDYCDEERSLEVMHSAGAALFPPPSDRTVVGTRALWRIVQGRRFNLTRKHDVFNIRALLQRASLHKERGIAGLSIYYDNDSKRLGYWLRWTIVHDVPASQSLPRMRSRLTEVFSDLGDGSLRIHAAKVMKNEHQLACWLSEIWGISAGWFAFNLRLEKLDSTFRERYRRFLRMFPSDERIWTCRMPRDPEGLFLPREQD